MSSFKEGGAMAIASKIASFSIGKNGASTEEEELQRRKTLLQRRSAVSAEVTSLQDVESFCPKVVPKNEEAKQRIQQALKENYLFKFLDQEQSQIVIDAVEEVKFNKDDVVIKQGDPGDHFYLLEEGTCEVWLQRPNNAEPEMVKEYSAGDSFGELALLYNAPRAATVKASSNCTLWAMDRMTFRKILLHTTSQKRTLYENFLDDVPLLKTLDSYEKAAIADVLEAEYFNEGQEILVEGHPGDKFYLLEEGEAEAKTGGHVVKMYKRGDYFGELALLNNKPRAATVISVTKCKCVSIDRQSFKVNFCFCFFEIKPTRSKMSWDNMLWCETNVWYTRFFYSAYCMSEKKEHICFDKLVKLGKHLVYHSYRCHIRSLRNSSALYTDLMLLAWSYGWLFVKQKGNEFELH